MASEFVCVMTKQTGKQQQWSILRPWEIYETVIGHSDNMQFSNNDGISNETLWKRHLNK